MSAGQRRVRPGTPSGGQWAAQQRGESDVSLVDDTGSGQPDWAKAGFDDDEARRWSGAGFEPADASAWRAAGWWPGRAAEWRSFDDSTPDEAMDWAAEGFGPKTAAEYKKIGVPSGADAAKWARSGPGTTTPERVAPWARAGFTAAETDSADDWASRGFDAAGAGRWLRGFRIDEAADAAMWRDAGYDDPMEAQDLESRGYRPEKLSPTLHFTGRTAFKIAHGTAVYEVRTCTEQDASDHGCPGATHVMAGEHEVRYGRLEAVTGKRLKKTPGWHQRRSVAADFVCDEDPDWQPLRGYVGE